MQYTLISKNYEEFTLLPEDPTQQPIYFKDAKLASRGLPGDGVSITTNDNTMDNESNFTLKVDRRGEYPPLIGFLDLKSKTIHGYTSKGAPIVIFHPYDRRFPPFRVGSSKPRTDNLLVSVKFESWNTSENLPRGSITDYLGIAGDINAELIALSLLRNPWSSKYTMLPDNSLIRPLNPNLKIFPNNYITVHIDPEGCKDIDDAISFLQEGPDMWEIAIHIADVAEKIDAGGEYDKFARRNASTVYSTEGKAIRSMLPIHISEDICSLIKGKWKRTVALTFNWQPSTKQITNKKFVEAQTLITHSATYENVKYVLPGETYECLRNMTAHMGADPEDTHTWVEVLMIAYNVEVANALPEGYGIIRTQAASKSPQHAIITTNADLKFLYLEQAKYEIKGSNASEKQTHHSLGNLLYCHATSPIRRYADLVNQRAIKALINNTLSVKPVKPVLTIHLNQREKQIKQAERNMLFVEAIYKSKQTAVKGMIVSKSDTKTKLYVPTWKKLINYKGPLEYPIGSEVTIEFFFDPTQRSWENKVVLRIKKED
jgi:exoribonuclease R